MTKSDFIQTNKGSIKFKYNMQSKQMKIKYLTQDEVA